MTESPAAAPDVFAFRRTARRRAWLCPGAGFAFVGRSRLGAATFAFGLAALIAAIATALAPSVLLLRTTVALLVAGTALWLVELAAVSNAWPTNPPPPRTADRRHIWGAALLMLTAAGFGLAMFDSYRLVEIQGEGMAPLVWNKDRLLYHRRVDESRLRRGAVVLFGLPPENNFADPGTLMLGRILALPGDKLSIVNFRYRVNDEPSAPAPPQTDLPNALVVPREPKSITVPENCYFVIQDDRENGIDSQVVGYARRDQIVSTDLYQVQRRPLLTRIE